MSNLELENLFSSKKALIPYLTFGYPSISFTKECIEECFTSGADCIELGIPFSDPLADGPVIQHTHQAALNTGECVDIHAALSCVKEMKEKINKPFIFMSSYNLIFHYGLQSFFKDASEHGLAGIVIPDLPIEEAEDCLALSKQYQVALILLISPSCSDERLTHIVSESTGFLYVISSTGLTGERSSFSTQLPDLMARIKRVKNIPVCVGFGLSQTEHLDYISPFSDGAIIGSHFAKIILENEPKKALTDIGNRLRLFKSHLK